MPKGEQTAARYMIQTVAKRAGLKPDLIRAWERRYAAVTPLRSDGGRRLYSELDIKRLRLLHQATGAGHSIGQIAKLSIEELEKLLRSGDVDNAMPQPLERIDGGVESYIQNCYAAVADFDAETLEALLQDAIVELGALRFIEDLVSPLMTRIGDGWQAGRLRPVHEHMALAVVRSTAYQLRTHYPQSDDAPRVVFATPVNQLHELGTLFASVLAENDGWRSVYLGANLPAEEIAAAVKFTDAHAMVIGLGHICCAVSLRKEFTRLRTLAGYRVALIVGGCSADMYQSLWDEIGARRVESFFELRQVLAELRRDVSLNVGIYGEEQ